MSDINQIISSIAKRAATKAAELHVQAESKFNGAFHTPVNLGLRFEAKGLEELSSMLTKLVNVLDPVEAEAPAETAIPVLPFKLVVPGEAATVQTPAQTDALVEGSAI